MKNKRKRPSKKQHHNSFKSFWIIALFAILPLIYGVYLCTPEIQAVFFQQPKYQDRMLHVPIISRWKSEDSGFPIPINRADIHHKGYTVSYNKDKKSPIG